MCERTDGRMWPLGTCNVDQVLTDLCTSDRKQKYVYVRSPSLNSLDFGLPLARCMCILIVAKEWSLCF